MGALQPPPSSHVHSVPVSADAVQGQEAALIAQDGVEFGHRSRRKGSLIGQLSPTISRKPLSEDRPENDGDGDGDGDVDDDDSDEDDDDVDDQDSFHVASTLIYSTPAITLRLVQSFPDLAIAAWHLLVLLPLSIWLAAASHIILGRSNWIRGGGPRRLVWPIRRSKGWQFKETAGVAVVGHLMAAFRHVSRTPFCPSAEKLIPVLSHHFFGVRHQGWSLHGRTVEMAAVPAELIVQLDSQSQSASASHEARGPALASQSAAAILLWKSRASSVHHHEVQTVKPAVDVAGLGSGRAKRGERVLLLLSGSSYADRDPVSGLFACNLVNLTGLRTLCINWRKPAPSSAGEHGAFPAGLNDAIQAYTHLVRALRFRPENVYLVAEGSGAGLAMALMMWLSTLQQSTSTRPAAIGLGRPGKVILWSPWCDLTMRSPTWETNGQFDIKPVKASRKARDLYISSLHKQQSARKSRSHGTPDKAQQPPGQIADDGDKSLKRTGTMTGSSATSSPVGPLTPQADLEVPFRTPSPQGFSLANGDAKQDQRPSFGSALGASPANVKEATIAVGNKVGPRRGAAEVYSQRLPPAKLIDEEERIKTSDEARVQRALASAWASPSTDRSSLLVSSILQLKAEHPLLSPGLPTQGCGSDLLVNAEASTSPLLFNEAVFSTLASRNQSSTTSSAPTQYLIFCGSESVLSGESAALARNLSIAFGIDSDSSATKGNSSTEKTGAKDSDKADIEEILGNVRYVSTQETPTVFNLMPNNTFLPHQQEKAEDVVRAFLVGDAKAL
ncbi:unnamed protein product [Jaminaea pallidilutea]